MFEAVVGPASSRASSVVTFAGSVMDDEPPVRLELAGSADELVE